MSTSPIGKIDTVGPRFKVCNMGQLDKELEGQYATLLESFDQICEDGFQIGGKLKTKV